MFLRLLAIGIGRNFSYLYTIDWVSRTCRSLA